MEWILYASAAVWLGIGAYVFCLMRRQNRLSARLRALESDREQA